jgi:hypothetical protein
MQSLAMEADHGTAKHLLLNLTLSSLAFFREPCFPGSPGQQVPTIVSKQKGLMTSSLSVMAITHKDPTMCQTHIYISLIFIKQPQNMGVK